MIIVETPTRKNTMNTYNTQESHNGLPSLPKDVSQYLILAPKGVSEEYTSLSGTSFMYVDKHYESGSTDEVWDEEDLIDPDATAEEIEETLSKFKKVLVLWFE